MWLRRAKCTNVLKSYILSKLQALLKYYLMKFRSVQLELPAYYQIKHVQIMARTHILMTAKKTHRNLSNISCKLNDKSA